MLNSRVRYEGKRGTVRYIGPVASDSKPREWLGIEWDIDGDGKHDGSCVNEKTGQVHRYFTCAHGKGSFVKPEKVSLAVSFREAYAGRYHNADKAVEGVLVSSSVTKTDLSTAGLENSNLGLADWEEDLDFDFIETLDVSGTLFQSWADVLLLASRLPKLKTLIARNNQVLEAGTCTSALSLPCLETLVLTNCGRESVTHVLRLLAQSVETPVLQALHVSHCELETIPDSIPKSVQEIDLSFNLLSLLTKAEMEKLRQYRMVLLNGNSDLKLDDSVFYGSPATSVQTLPALERLALGDTSSVQTWKQLDVLGSIICPTLRDLRMWNVPLVHNEVMGPSSKSSSDPAYPSTTTIRAKVLVRFPLLTKLNGTDISEKMRSEAELLCLKAGDVFPNRDLVAVKHGLDINDDSSSSKRPTKVPALLTVRFESPAEDCKTVVRKLPWTTKLSNIHTIYIRLFAVKLGEADILELRQGGQERPLVVENSDRFCLRDLVSHDDLQVSEVSMRLRRT